MSSGQGMSIEFICCGIPLMVGLFFAYIWHRIKRGDYIDDEDMYRRNFYWIDDDGG